MENDGERESLSVEDDGGDRSWRRRSGSPRPLPRELSSDEDDQPQQPQHVSPSLPPSLPRRPSVPVSLPPFLPRDLRPSLFPCLTPSLLASRSPLPLCLISPL